MVDIPFDTTAGIAPAEVAEVGAAEPCRGIDECIQNGLQIEGRPADDLDR